MPREHAPRTQKHPSGDKRSAVLQAALELIAERGLQHTPMSLVAKRARASAGIIYHYFASKEALLAALYGQIKGDMARAILAADDPQQPLATRFQTLWISIFRYCRAHPQELAFLDQYESLPVARRRDAWHVDGTASVDTLIHDLRSRREPDDLPSDAKMLVGLIADLRAQNLIKDLPLAAIGEFTLGVASRLARHAAGNHARLDESALTCVAEACWDAIAR